MKETISSRHSAIRPVIVDIMRELECLRWSKHDRFAIRLALHEALSNSIAHGSKGDLEKVVSIEWEISPHRFHVAITDQGSGFTGYAVPDPTSPEHLAKVSGRGIFLMRKYMSSVRYNELGIQVVMKKEATRST